MFRALIRILRAVRRKTVKLSLWAAAIVLILLLASALLSRFKPELQPWHIKSPRSEFKSYHLLTGFSFADYLSQEEKVFEELRGFYVVSSPKRRYSPVLRFYKDGKNNPSTFPVNWNRTQEKIPKDPKGAILLLHGLSDSPYSLRSIGEIFYKAGYHVVYLRLPGHGTTPSGLINVRWQDWRAATRVAAEYLVEKAGDKPFFVAGYSNGGALALEYATQAVLKGKSAPDAVFLFSPAVAVTGFARFSNWHKVFTWIPYFQRDRWLSILPEIDPFKYNSFTKNAGAQVWQLARVVQRNLDQLASRGRIDALPPILTFQSVVDSTVVGRAVVERLYRRLSTPDSELVIFDIVRSSSLYDLLVSDPYPQLESLLKGTPLAFRFTLLTNESNNYEVMEVTRPPSSDQIIRSETGLKWPRQLFSLSHGAIPFRPDDPIYGDGRDGQPEFGISLGDLALRGERGVLFITSELMLRLRYNPFYPYMEARILEWIERFE